MSTEHRLIVDTTAHHGVTAHSLFNHCF